jgi:hypothetical protein
MEKEFVTYEQALALKELGFDEECFAFYNGKFLDSTDYNFDDDTSKDIGLCIKVPLKQQVFRWFREKYDLTGLIHIGSKEFSFSVNKDGHRITPLKEYLNYNGTYEEAENVCIDKLIELAKQK